MEKSIGELIDDLSITNLKCFWYQETIMKGASFEEVANAAKQAQQMNARRNKLVIEINKYFKDTKGPTEKTYQEK